MFVTARLSPRWRYRLGWLLLVALIVAMSFFLAVTVHAQTPDPRQDTTYVLGANTGSGYTPEVYTVMRHDSLMGQVVRTTVPDDPALPWIAQSPGWFAGSWNNLAYFAAMRDAIHAVVVAFNAAHPLPPGWTPPPPVDTTPTPVPVDTTPAPPATLDTSYSFVRIACPAASPPMVTCYQVNQATRQHIGVVYQVSAGQWQGYLTGNPTPVAPFPFPTRYQTAQRLVSLTNSGTSPTPVPPVDTTTVDTLHVHYVISVDTIFLRPGDTVTLQPDSNHIIIPVRVVKPDTVVQTIVRVDTVRVPVPTPSDTTGYCADSVVFVDSDFPNTDSNLAAYQHCQYIGRILYSPMTTLAVDSTPWLAVPKGYRQTLGRFKSEYLAMQALKPGAPVRTPVELPHMGGMDTMLESAYASDTVTRQVFDQVPVAPFPLKPRLDSLGRAVCSANATYFPCPAGFPVQPMASSAARAQPRATSQRRIPVKKEP